jgi:MerR family transcriptional regulator, light-induced transcriptional regulator
MASGGERRGGGNDSSRSRVGDCRMAKLSEFGRLYVDALLCADERAAEIAIREAMDAKLSTAEIDDEIIAPALWLIGELWQRGELSISDEHLATEISIRVIALQREAQRVAQSRGGHRLVLATPQGDLHVVALRMAGNLLHDAGYDVVMLGPDVPSDALAASARRHGPAVVCMSATLPGGFERVMGAIEEVHRASPAVGFVVGGRGIGPQLQTRPGVTLCQRVSEVVEAVDAAVKHAGLN